MAELTLAEQVMRELNIWSKAVSEGMQDAAERALKEADSVIRSHVGFTNRTGDYMRSWTIAKGEKSGTRNGAVWYAAPPHYRLTHLLEDGHRTRNGGFTRAFPHISYGEVEAVKLYEEYVKEVIANA